MPAIDATLAYLTTGTVAGFFAGLLGVGGGVIVVPILAMLFAAQGFPAREVFHLALGTSMATILFTSVSSLRAHHAHGAVLWPVVRAISPSILAGTFLGAHVAVLISSRQLSIFFAGFMFFVAFQMFANRQPSPSRTLPGLTGISLAGLIIGTVATLAAIGGGALTVPYLVRCNVQPHKAIGTSSAVGLPIAFGGTMGYIWNGLAYGDLPAGSLGFVYLPALTIILVASLVTAPIGARTAHRLPVGILKRIFAMLLLILAGKMLWSLFSAP